MKITSTIARILLGVIFLTFGLNGFFHFIPMPPPTGLAGQYLGALFVSGYLIPVFLLQIIGGALLLSGRFIPLALSLLAPVLVNILLFHCFMAPAGLPLALLAAVLWLLVFVPVRSVFSGLLISRV